MAWKGMIYEKTNLGLNICHQADVHVIERFGRLLGTQRPGLYMAIPIVDTIRVVRTSEVCLNVPPLRATTQDNVMVETSGSAYVQVLDPVAALYGHVDPYGAVGTHVQASDGDDCMCEGRVCSLLGLGLVVAATVPD